MIVPSSESMLYETRSKLLVFVFPLCYLVFRSHFYALCHPHGTIYHILHQLDSFSREHFSFSAHPSCCWYLNHGVNCLKYADCFIEGNGGMSGTNGGDGSRWVRVANFLRLVMLRIWFIRRRLLWCFKKRYVREKKPRWITISIREVLLFQPFPNLSAFNESKDMGLLKGYEEDRKKEVNELEVLLSMKVDYPGMVWRRSEGCGR